MSFKPKHYDKRLVEKRKRTYLRMVKSIVGTTLAIIIVLIILQLLGINVSSMLAGVGIVSIVVGFALQDALKDIIRGIEIISSGYYDIGDVIKFGDNLGQVQSVTLRTTKIQDINTMNTVSIANRNIDKVEVDNGYIYLQIPLPYELAVNKADVVMREIAGRIAVMENVTSADYQDVTEISDSALKYQMVITCEPLNRLSVRRGAVHAALEILTEHKIKIPYNQIEVHGR